MFTKPACSSLWNSLTSSAPLRLPMPQQARFTLPAGGGSKQEARGQTPRHIVLCASQVSDQPFNFTGTYTIDGVSGSNSVTLNPVETNSGPVLSGGITITVFPALAPNRWGSPSWNAWASNAVTAILNGYSSYGDPSSPTFYQQITNAVPVTNNMVTSFPSWMGVGRSRKRLWPGLRPGIGQPADVWHGHQGRDESHIHRAVVVHHDLDGSRQHAGLDLLAHSLLVLGIEYRQRQSRLSGNYLRSKRPEHLCHQRPGDPIGQ